MHEVILLTEKVVKTVVAILSSFSFEFSENFQSSLCSE